MRDDDPLPEVRGPRSAREQAAMWQRNQLEKLGFTPIEAEAILAAGRSWHDASDLLAAGCERELACLILA
jgi:hypothetical protein